MDNIEKFKLRQKIYVACCRNLWIFQKVKEDLQWLDKHDNALRCLMVRLKREMVLEIMGNTPEYIMELIAEDYEFRRLIRFEDICDLKNRGKVLASMCCRMPVVYIKDGEEDAYYCEKCDHETKTIVIHDNEVAQFKESILEAMSRDSKNLQDFFVNMRKTRQELEDLANKRAAIAHEHTKVPIVDVAGKEVPIDPEIKKDISMMDGQQREDISKGLLKRIEDIDAEIASREADSKKKKEEPPDAKV